MSESGHCARLVRHPASPASSPSTPREKSGNGTLGALLPPARARASRYRLYACPQIAAAAAGTSRTAISVWRISCSISSPRLGPAYSSANMIELIAAPESMTANEISLLARTRSLPDAGVRIDNDICVQQNHGSLVNFRSSSQRMFGTLFHFRIAIRTSAFVRLFPGASRCIRRSTISGPLRSHANTSPGAAPGSTTRFLLSCCQRHSGLSHMGRRSQNVCHRKQIRPLK